MAQPEPSRDTGLWIVVALVLLLVLVPAVFMMGFWGTGMMGTWGTGLWWGPAIGMVGGVVILAVVLVLVIRALQGQPRPMYPAYAPPWPAPPVPWQSPEAAALRILDERYAKGEISREEYLKMRGDLEKGAR